MSDTRVWKPIPIDGANGYEVSNDGLVRSYKLRGFRNKVNCAATIRKPTYNKDGYARVSMVCDGKYKLFNVHKLVLLAFKGQPPSGFVACHNDGNPKNNHINNLRWDTQYSNMQDKIKHGTSAGGALERDNHGCTKIKTNMFGEIAKLKKQGVSARAIAKRFDVNPVTIYRVLTIQSRLIPGEG